MANGDTKTEALLNILGNGGDASSYRGCCNTKTQDYILDAIDRVQAVEDEVERLENNPDVVDIVATYQDLQSYDTSGLTDKDIIRVLQDETHDGNSTYYRWNATTSQFDFVGEIAGGGGITELTSADYNWPVDNPTGIALWLLEPGYYIAKGTSITIWPNANTTVGTTSNTPIMIADYGYSYKIISVFGDPSGLYGVVYRTRVSDGYEDVIFRVINNLTSTSSGSPLSAYQGKVLNDKIGGNLANLVTTDKTSLINAINEVAGQGGGGSSVNVVQTPGASTTDVMSQNATTSMIYADLNARRKVRIGNDRETGAYSVNIGHSDTSLAGFVAGMWSVGIGYNIGVDSGSNYSVAIGSNSRISIYKNGAVALGAYSGGNITATGMVDFGSSNTSYGYSSSNYRLLTGLYDPQSAHDAATKGYVDPTTDSSAPTTATVGRLGQIQIDTTTNTAYMCVAVDDVTPSYSWKQITA